MSRALDTARRRPPPAPGGLGPAARPTALSGSMDVPHAPSPLALSDHAADLQQLRNLFLDDAMEAHPVVSVMEVRNALRCPRAFVLGRAGKAVTFPLGPTPLTGTFHQLLERLARQTALSATAPDAALPEVVGAEALKIQVLALLTEELCANPLFASLPAAVDQLMEACRQLAAHLSARMEDAGLPLSRLLNAGDKDLDWYVPEVGLQLKGRLEGALLEDNTRLDVVEFAFPEEIHLALDQVQVALYHALLQRMDQGQAKPVILRFNPAPLSTTLDAEASEHLFEAEVLPLFQNMVRWIALPGSAPPTLHEALCANCPLLRSCVKAYPAYLSPRDNPLAGAARPRTNEEGFLKACNPVFPAFEAPAGDESAEDALDFCRKILEGLRQEGISAETADPTLGPALFLFDVCRLKGPLGQLDRVAESVCQRLDFPITYAKSGAKRQFAVPRPRAKKTALNALMAAKAEWLSERPGRFIVGQEPDGRILTGDLNDPASSNLLLGGQSGSGKTWLLRSIIASLIHFHPPARIRLTLMDPKRNAFHDAAFQSAVLAHCDTPVIANTKDILNCFERYVEIMEERYELFSRVRTEDLHDYNQSVPPHQRLPKQILILDGFHEFTLDKSTTEAFTCAIDRLGSKSRAAGIHLILATQRPERDKVPARLKSSLSGKIALKVASHIHSRVLLDQSGAEGLFGKGDLLADLGKGLLRAQAPTIE